MTVDGKRSFMIVKRSPGPYEDRWGPLVIGSLFVFAFTSQYCIFLASLSHEEQDYSDDYNTSLYD